MTALVWSITRHAGWCSLRIVPRLVTAARFSFWRSRRAHASALLLLILQAAASPAFADDAAAAQAHLATEAKAMKDKNYTFAIGE